MAHNCIYSSKSRKFMTFVNTIILSQQTLIARPHYIIFCTKTPFVEFKRDIFWKQKHFLKNARNLHLDSVSHALSVSNFQCSVTDTCTDSCRSRQKRIVIKYCVSVWCQEVAKSRLWEYIDLIIIIINYPYLVCKIGFSTIIN